MNANVTTWRAEPDIRDMMVVHRIFRREFPLLGEIVPRASDGDARRAGHVARHIDFCLDSLHHHHSAEDDYLWPKLLERARPHAELVRRMEAQHEDVAGCAEQARQLTAHWRAAPLSRTGTELATALARLSSALTEHLDEEEARILPLVRDHITVAEWEELGRKSFEKIPPGARVVAMGQILADGTLADQALFSGKLPPPARLMWRLWGRRRYARYIRNVREHPCPAEPLEVA